MHGDVDIYLWSAALVQRLVGTYLYRAPHAVTLGLGFFVVLYEGLPRLVAFYKKGL